MAISFGEAIREAREKKGLSLRETAKRADISHPYLSQLENEKAKQPSKAVIRKLASVLDIPYPYLDYFTDENIERYGAFKGIIPRILKNIDKYRWLEEVEDIDEFERRSIEIGALQKEHGLEKEDLASMLRMLKMTVERYDLTERAFSLQEKSIDSSLAGWSNAGIEIKDLFNTLGKNVLYKGRPLTEKEREKILAITEILLVDDEEGDDEH
ncbi:helix-turn-helix domain-containing protein [Bhargavaea beijingensis]|uniref:XRE family transcriptional regulator n=1 Tax=Bhargavaea beijingensis TaxID=426756 RepID=A0ABX9ZC94_9BACL|nr:helix-turn-helix transcriptional regulator [Bhargavaea beijingensis]RSK30983.1 XRE family transcriptional regulator [Bhargavaea beijingensis]